MSIFNSIKAPKIKKTTFNLSHNYVGACSFGKLIPFCCLETVPGDRFKLRSEVLVESFPMLADIYGDIDVKTEYFFVPNRLLWDKWEDFITGGEDGTLEPVVPRLYKATSKVPTFAKSDNTHIGLQGTLWDYFGLPINPVDDVNYPMPDDTVVILNTDFMPSALPFYAYRKIWNDWYRNENIQDEIPAKAAANINDNYFENLIYPLYRNWRKDYFTSSLPFVQRGVSPLVQVSGEGTLTFGPNAPSEVKNYLGNTSILPASSFTPSSPYALDDIVSGIFYINSSGEMMATEFSGGQISPSATVKYGAFTGISPNEEGLVYISRPENTSYEITPIVGDISQLTAVDQEISLDGIGFDINELRRVNSVQKWLERNARAGARYIEQIASHFGVTVPDYRLQRSEFLGGSTQPVRIGQVMQQNTPSGEPTLTDSLGYQAGRASTGMTSRTIKYTCLEHGFIIGLMSIVPRAQYFQGMDKMWMRSNKFDYYFPEFAHLGEQDVSNLELLYTDNDNPGTFGYQSRYSEYKWHRDVIVNRFRNDMFYYTLRRNFNYGMALSNDFVSLGTPSNNTLNNIFSVPSNPEPFRFYIKNLIKAKRPMPKYGTPKL